MTPTPTLSGDRVLLRPVADSDLPALLELLGHPDLLLWWGRTDEKDLREELAGANLTAWTIEVAGGVAGLVYATEEPEPSYRCVDLDIFLGAPHLGRGLGPEALRLVLRHMFEERGHHRATIFPAADNERAVRAYEKVGYRAAGRLRQADRAPDGAWRDAVAMDILAAELDHPRKETTP